MFLEPFKAAISFMQYITIYYTPPAHTHVHTHSSAHPWAHPPTHPFHLRAHAHTLKRLTPLFSSIMKYLSCYLHTHASLSLCPISVYLYFLCPSIFMSSLSFVLNISLSLSLSFYQLSLFTVTQTLLLPCTFNSFLILSSLYPNPTIWPLHILRLLI